MYKVEPEESVKKNTQTNKQLPKTSTTQFELCLFLSE